MKMKPPIVGVPALPLWASTYTLILWPAFNFFKVGIKIIPNIVDIIKPIIKANKDFVNTSIYSSHPCLLRLYHNNIKKF